MYFSVEMTLEVIVWRNTRLFSLRDKIWFFLQKPGIFDVLFVFRLNIFSSKISILLLPSEAKGAGGVPYAVYLGQIKRTRTFTVLALLFQYTFSFL